MRAATRSSEGLLLLGALLLLPGTGWTGDTPAAQECLACHSDKDLKRGAPLPGQPLSLFVDEAALKASAHGRLQCVGCHKTATAPHEERLPAVSCAGCHRRQVEVYKGSIHARSRERPGSEAATCLSCHGPAHSLLAKADPRSPTYHLNLPRTCAQCHADPELVKRYGIPVGNVYQLYMDSIHGRALTRSGLMVAANCSDCHGAHEINPRTEPASRVNRANVPATCGGCHAGILATYRQSIHGRQAAGGNPLAPICIDCHTAHEIRRVEVEAWKLDIVKECGTCHAESLQTYRDTFHGKITALGFTRVARCSDCHGAHDVVPRSDPRSRINPANLVTTCGKCHREANVNFARYDPHADPRNPSRNPLLHYAARFMTWLLVGVFAFFGVHTALWGTRALVARRRGKAPPSETEEPE